MYLPMKRRQITFYLFFVFLKLDYKKKCNSNRAPSLITLLPEPLTLSITKNLLVIHWFSINITKLQITLFFPSNRPQPFSEKNR